MGVQVEVQVYYKNFKTTYVSLLNTGTYKFIKFLVVLNAKPIGSLSVTHMRSNKGLNEGSSCEFKGEMGMKEIQKLESMRGAGGEVYGFLDYVS